MCFGLVQVAWPATYHFADVERIAAFQMAHLRALGVRDPQNWPQAKIAATEQGWNVCSASILMLRIACDLACGSEVCLSCHCNRMAQPRMASQHVITCLHSGW